MAPRERSRESLPVSTTLKLVDENGYIYTSSYDSTKSESMTDVVNENFHALSKAGTVFNNACAYRCDTVLINDSQSLWIQINQSDPENIVTKLEGNVTAGRIGNGRIPYQLDVCEAESPNYDVEPRCKQKAIAAIDSAPFGVGEDLAEIRETLQLLRNPLSGVAGLARAFQLRKRRIVNSSINEEAKLKAIANLWTQYRFAQAPLMRSIENLMDAWAAEGENLRPDRASSHGRDSMSNEADTTQWLALGISHKFRYDKWSTNTVEGHAAILYGMNNPLDDWRYRLGLRWKDLPTVAWEIIPLSFMVDRVVNIKDFISGLVNLSMPSLTILAASYTKKTTLRHEIWLTEETWSYGEYETIIVKPDSVTWTTFTYDRKPWSPSVVDTFPTFRWKGLVDDATKVADLLAVILTRLT